MIKMNVPPLAGHSFCLLVAVPPNFFVCTRRYEAAGVLIGRYPLCEQRCYEKKRGKFLSKLKNLPRFSLHKKYLPKDFSYSKVSVFVTQGGAINISTEILQRKYWQGRAFTPFAEELLHILQCCLPSGLFTGHSQEIADFLSLLRSVSLNSCLLYQS